MSKIEVRFSVEMDTDDFPFDTKNLKSNISLDTFLRQVLEGGELVYWVNMDDVKYLSYKSKGDN